ncbi:MULTISPECIES: hypothetical protein [unclassified Bradyrhizobium]|uniref:hypothetical protein n=1 Tax=unclassified Bradyrhizobium TaxID=2631580 RepID=UPI0020B4588B|nr:MULTISPECIES: hypothetical protein [unclassified Bradyrhizobium]MCP3380625.1 hypothetical protein [Bradyrhizobium sp. CCGUVB4N]MCP3441494.1 hypothetical protein [Bradyrhizobium sp. CCGUVB14]
MTSGVFDQCPVCGARLGGGDTCRRCRAELETVHRIAQQSATLVGAGLQSLATGDRAAAVRLLRRASTLRTTPDLTWILSALADSEAPDGRRNDPDPTEKAAW